MKRALVNALLGTAMLIVGIWTSPSIVEAERFDKTVLFDRTIIVKYKETSLQSTSPKQRRARMNDLAAGLLRQSSIKVTQTLPILGVQLLHPGSGQPLDSVVLALRRNPTVEYAEYNFRITGEQSAPQRHPNDDQWEKGGFWGLRKIGMTNAWVYQTDANSITVAVIDSGIDYAHEDIAPNMWTDSAGMHGYNHCANTGDPADTMGHGTLVGGVIGARGNNVIGAVGADWQVKLLALKALCQLDDDGISTGGVAQAVAAINSAMTKGAHIINNSWRVIPPISSGDLQTLLYAVRRTNCEGTGTAPSCIPALFVAAAGNGRAGECVGRDLDECLNSDTNPVYPANFGAPPHSVGNVIAVAAAECDPIPDCSTRYSLWDNSHHGDKVHIAAPGVNIDSTYLWNPPNPPESYTAADGTSMSAPHVSGCAALLQAQNLSTTNHLLSIAELKNLLLDSADTPFKDHVRRPQYGRGLNCARAMNRLSNKAPLAPVNLTVR